MSSSMSSRPYDLILGDCLEALGRVPDKSVDMVLTDLPYGTTYADFDGVLKNMTRYTKTSVIDLAALWAHYERVVMPDSAIVLFGGQPFTSALVASNPTLYKYGWVWMKNKAGNHVTVRYQPLKIHEDILVFSQAGVNTGAAVPLRYFPQGVAWGKRTRSRSTDVKKAGTYRYNSLRAGEYEVEGAGYPRSVLEFDVPSGEDRCHPTQKPVDLLEYLIRSYTRTGELVLDSCMGSGSTGVAAINAGRRFLGMEIAPEYYGMAVQRIERAHATPSLFYVDDPIPAAGPDATSSPTKQSQ